VKLSNDSLRRIFSRSRAIFAGRTQIVSRSFSQSLSANAEDHKFQSIATPLVVSTLVLIGILSADRQLDDRTKLESVASIGSPEIDGAKEADDDTTDIINWSGTHKVTIANDKFWEPESLEEVEAIVRECHRRGQAVRPLGSSLSPNGIAFNEAGMISIANLDKVLNIDTDKMTITVQAGITVQRVRMTTKLGL
jgi:hypothetical protein